MQLSRLSIREPVYIEPKCLTFNCLACKRSIVEFFCNMVAASYTKSAQLGMFALVNFKWCHLTYINKVNRKQHNMHMQRMYVSYNARELLCYQLRYIHT